MKKEIKCRLVKIALENGVEEILGTSLLDTVKYKLPELGELYQIRWGAEEGYKMYKARVQVEAFGRAQRALKQLLKDGYVYEGKDANKDPERPPNYSYTITPIGQYFVENEGYEEKARKNKFRDRFSIEIPSSVIKTNRTTRRLYWVSVFFSRASAVASVANFYKKDDKDALSKELIQIQRQVDSLTLQQRPLTSPSYPPNTERKIESSKQTVSEKKKALMP